MPSAGLDADGVRLRFVCPFGPDNASWYSPVTLDGLRYRTGSTFIRFVTIKTEPRHSIWPPS